ncbi:MAG: pentapeptide repeat-containing protein [bacterium]|nr:pentapeptide repeat-containing protein [bacterium]
MALAEHVERLEMGLAAWNQWRAANPELKPDLSGLTLGPHEIILQNANFQGCDLSGASFQNTQLSNADFSRADLRRAKFQGGSVKRAKFWNCDCTGMELAGGLAVGAHFKEARLTRARLVNQNCTQAILNTVDLTGAVLNNVSLTESKLKDTNFSGAVLEWVNLTGAEFRGSKFSHRTKLRVRFDENHSSFSDGSDELVYSASDRLNWGFLRAIGRFPLFAVSWSALLACLVTINTIGLLNERMLIDSIQYPVPVPHRMSFILLGSLLLVVGTTIYRTRCPLRVQEFSETRWVEEHGHPRLLYVSEKLSRRGSQWLTALSTLLGGILGLVLVGERIWISAGYVWRFGLERTLRWVLDAVTALL